MSYPEYTTEWNEGTLVLRYEMCRPIVLTPAMLRAITKAQAEVVDIRKDIYPFDEDEHGYRADYYEK